MNATCDALPAVGSNGLLGISCMAHSSYKLHCHECYLARTEANKTAEVKQACHQCYLCNSRGDRKSGNLLVNRRSGWVAEAARVEGNPDWELIVVTDRCLCDREKICVLIHAPNENLTNPKGLAARLVRLDEPLAGTYCTFEAGEIVKISQMDDGTWRVERPEWTNSLTITNVLCGVPDSALMWSEPNDKVLP